MGIQLIVLKENVHMNSHGLMLQIKMVIIINTQNALQKVFVIVKQVYVNVLMVMKVKLVKEHHVLMIVPATVNVLTLKIWKKLLGSMPILHHTLVMTIHPIIIITGTKLKPEVVNVILNGLMLIVPKECVHTVMMLWIID